MSYRWVITADHIQDVGSKSRIGVSGPGGCDPNLTANKAKWKAYDDDQNLYYEGDIFGDYTGFEPLDDFCMPDAGCTMIRLNGEWL